MNDFIAYQLQAGILIALAWLIYRVLLRDLDVFTMNRGFLLAVLPLAYLLPWLAEQLDEAFPALAHFQLRAIGIATEVSVTNITPDISPLLLIYLSGVGVYLASHFWNLFRVIQLLASSKPSSTYPGEVLHNPAIRGTYAFLHRVIWNESQVAPDEREILLRHERVHIRQAHTIDILLTEWVAALQWFNPFIYLIRRDIREVHEFLADRGSLDGQGDRTAYLRIMLHRALGGEAGTIINAFGKVSLKRRIIMMTKENRKGWFPRYTLATVVFMLLALWAFHPSGGTATALSAPGITLDPLTELPLSPPQEKKFQEVKSMPQYPGGQEAMIRFLVENIKYPEQARKKGLTGTVYVSFVVSEKGELGKARVEKGISQECDDEALRVVKLMTSWKPAINADGKPIAAQMTLPVKFELSDKKKN